MVKTINQKTKQEPRKLYVLYSLVRGDLQEDKKQVPEKERRNNDIYAFIRYQEKYPSELLCTAWSEIKFKVHNNLTCGEESTNCISNYFDNSNIGTDDPFNAEEFIKMVADYNKAQVVRTYAHNLAARTIHHAGNAKKSLDSIL